MNFKGFKQISTVAFVVFFIGATSCSQSSSSTNKERQELLHPSAEKKPPTSTSDTNSSDEEANIEEEENNRDSNEDEQSLDEEEGFFLVTKIFETYLPRGLYQGATEAGEPCQITVKPFKNAGKDLVIEVEVNHTNPHETGSDKVSITLAPGQNIKIIGGVPTQDPPVMRVWVEIVVPYFRLEREGNYYAIKLLSIKFDPASKKPQKVYLFDQTREGLGKIAINCAIKSFEPKAWDTYKFGKSDR